MATLSEQEIRKEIESITLPSYFPTYKQQCKEVAENFFNCFSSRSIKTQKGDRLAGVSGLRQCSQELSKYKECMEH
ncbi:hypothetical protein C9374_009165 [Naegleria lovaniensis]|uniref:Uncharacterized protein n=1 Tax=Naegleria lovaniensis TaxID=51637 RepID=A0AA88GE19_NAELO|nr:uncharacterized protein C9374_009165 [Naegleria lovaniensis]KAG2377649.1 hypothetical protein C9374_009165 [Naegleria lovaniensis]